MSTLVPRQSEASAVTAAPAGLLAPVALDRNRVNRGWLMRRVLLLADMLGVTVAYLVAAILAPTESVGRLDVGAEVLVLVASLPLWVVAARLQGLYDRDEEHADHSTVDDVIGVLHVVTLGVWVVVAATYLATGGDVPIARFVVFWAGALVAVPLARAGARGYARRHTAFVQRVLVVGAGDVGRLVARKAAAHPELRIDVVGFLDAAPKGPPDADLPPVLGAPSDLSRLVPALGIDRVIVAFSADSHEATLDLVRLVKDFDVQVDIVPRLFEVVGSHVHVHNVEGIPLLGLPPLRLSHSSRFLKRSLDVAGSVLGLVFLAPLFAVVAVAIKLDSPGPVFFRQVRMGAGEETFRIFKFRTMCSEAERLKAQLAHLNMHRGGDARMFKVAEDPRVTRVGRWLRRSSVDELPQLINVLRGEMSLVGPRPLILDEDCHVEAWARKRLALKPGITGLWQVLGRSDIPFEEMTKLDYLYVTNWSLTQDLRLIFLTLPSLLRSRKAF